ncbi:hypothetical protein GWK47_014124 [Chionoecetes opilio]|uniref:Uncharacterized protein n=1 Tax=Chionoecetes opilio TaxID=41210 RepID=A0A8J5CNK5_CHIOP|nr:hypothetical protein GWK47_014124 [Chionoecetes opilio]
MEEAAQELLADMRTIMAKKRPSKDTETSLDECMEAAVVRAIHSARHNDNEAAQSARKECECSECKDGEIPASTSVMELRFGGGERRSFSEQNTVIYGNLKFHGRQLVMKMTTLNRRSNGRGKSTSEGHGRGTPSWSCIKNQLDMRRIFQWRSWPGVYVTRFLSRRHAL